MYSRFAGRAMLRKDVHPEKAYCGISVTAEGITTVSRDAQSVHILLGIDVTFLGKLRYLSERQFENMPSLSSVESPPKLTDERDEHSAKAYAPAVSTSSGISTDLSAEHP